MFILDYTKRDQFHILIYDNLQLNQTVDFYALVGNMSCGMHVKP